MKDRPLWSRVSRTLWRSTDFRKMGPMPPSTPGLWIFLLTGEHCKSVPGLFVLGVGTLRDDLGWPEAAIKKHLAELVALGHVKVDPVAKVMWLPNALHHNFPDNPNMVAGWKRDWHAIPDCDLKTEAQVELRRQLAEVAPKLQRDSAGNVVRPASMTPYADSFDIAIGVRQPNPSPNPSGKGKGNPNPKDGGDDRGNVTPPVRSDLTPNVDQTEEREKEREQTPPRAHASEGAPAHEGDAPDPEVVVDQSKIHPDPVDPEVEDAKPRPRPVLVPPSQPSTADLLDAMVRASKGHFDIRRGNATVLRAIGERLRAYAVTMPLAVRMGALLATPHKTFPTATGIGADSIVSILWLMGSPDREGTYNAAWLGDLISQAEAAEKAEAKRAEAEAARQRAPGPVPAGKTDPVALAALRRTLRQSPTEAPSDAIVTLTTGAQ